MFDKLTPEQRGTLTAKLEQAAAEVLAEVKTAVKMGRVTFDFAYGHGVAEQYVGIAGDLVGVLADLATSSFIPAQ